MKTLLNITTLVFTLMFSSTSFAGWTKVSSNMGKQNTYFVDFERIRKVDGFVYFWTLSDYSKPLEGTLSTKIHWQGDCKLLRNKVLSFPLIKNRWVVELVKLFLFQNHTKTGNILLLSHHMKSF